MPAKIVITVVKGKLAGNEYVFDETTTCIIGRAVDCGLKLPDDEHHRGISRHHCLLDINPPDIRVRDFGSLNGTYVNDRRIGGRDRDQQAREAQNQSFPQYDLKNGDHIKLGQTVLKVGVYIPAACRDCGREIPEETREQTRIEGDEYQCLQCRQAEAQAPRQTAASKTRQCPICGGDVSRQAGRRQGDFACAECRQDPMKIIKFLMKKAEKPETDLPGIQGYNIIKLLGRGGMGAVYLAENQMTGQKVALKLMLPQVAVDKQAEERFLREVRMCKALKHPNVVELMDSGASQGSFFFTLEYCDGGTVEDVMKQTKKPLPVETAVSIILQALDGLEYAHNAVLTTKDKRGELKKVKGLVHRDLKPANIFLSGSGNAQTAKVADFGLAKAFRGSGLSGLTATGTAAGSPWFMPRAQVLNFKYSKPTVDVWGMTATLYCMLTLAFPRNFRKGADPWMVVLKEKPVPILMRRKGLPPRLAEVIDEALMDEDGQAFDSAGAFKKALEAAFR